MKKYLFLLLSIVLFTACAKEDEASANIEGIYGGDVRFAADEGMPSMSISSVVVKIEEGDITISSLPLYFAVDFYANSFSEFNGLYDEHTQSLFDRSCSFSIKQYYTEDNKVHAILRERNLTVGLNTVVFEFDSQSELVFDYQSGGALSVDLVINAVTVDGRERKVNAVYTIEAQRMSIEQALQAGSQFE